MYMNAYIKGQMKELLDIIEEKDYKILLLEKKIKKMEDKFQEAPMEDKPEEYYLGYKDGYQQACEDFSNHSKDEDLNKIRDDIFSIFDRSIKEEEDYIGEELENECYNLIKNIQGKVIIYFYEKSKKGLQGDNSENRSEISDGEITEE